MALKSSAPGPFTVPTAPSPGTVVAQSAVANTYGTYVQALASTAAALYITGIQISAVTTQVPTYVNVQIGTGPGASEVTQAQVQLPVDYTAGVANSQLGGFVDIWPPIPVAIATRIALKTASDAASAINWNVSLQCVAQANVVDAGINESVNVIQVNGTAQTARDLGLNCDATISSRLAGANLTQSSISISTPRGRPAPGTT